jgi:Divergent InlB B-repeat domain
MTAAIGTARNLAVPILMLAILFAGVGEAAGAVIPVTTVEQKINGLGGCSLQEAIYSANFDTNLAISRYEGSTPFVILTQCVRGSGDDIIVLPAGAVLQLSKIVDDADNPTGPTATPIITSNITILAYGATFQRTGNANLRLFAVGDTGHLTIRRAYIRGFRAQGGNGGNGGGGGLGAGGAIYVMRGGLVIEASTFEGNLANGGTGGTGHGGGGGGLGGNGGPGFEGTGFGCFSGGGGGGARGNGANGCTEGGGGGGTIRSASSTKGGFDCGADGTRSGGATGPCAGGGGSGGALTLTSPTLPCGSGHDGGRGNYGGGGGGGEFACGGDGGHGGVGGGGGGTGEAGYFGEDGGNGGFGGGGGMGANGAITDGVTGDGGFFAGNGNSRTGGGGAGLGGAIFNDSGSVEIRSSTLTGNIAVGGVLAKTNSGSGGGAAIFSRNGYLTVLNTTISGNVSVFGIGGGIIVAQDSASAPTSFVLENSIVANNGERECAIAGVSIGVAFAGNLIMSNADGSSFRGKTFAGCQGVVASTDPQLGPLQYNEGPTPTMAIGSSSPAWNAADPGSSLPVDQRKQQRPAMGGFDIGAFELCLEGFGKLQTPCLILFGYEDPGGSGQAVQLTIDVQPPGGGTTIPAAGTKDVAQDSVVALKATPNTGFRFTEWSQNVTNPGQPATTVFMNTSQTVTANFETCDCASDVSSSIGITFGGVTVNPVTRRYVQTVTLTNNSTFTITGPISLVLDKLTANVTLSNASGTTVLMLPAGSPYISASTNLAAGQSIAVQLQFTNPSNIVFSYEPRVLAGPGSR